MEVYTFREPSEVIPGIIAIVVAGSLSLVAVLGLLAFMLVSFLRRSSTHGHGQSAMGDKHMTAYFYSLLLASILKALSVMLSVRWTYAPMMSGAYCQIQAGLKLAGNVGTAVWSMVIAMHIFNLLFLSLRPNKWSLPAVVGGVWSLLLADVFIGPAIFADFFSPYDGNDGDGTSCWISNRHPAARFMLEYFPTGLTPFVSIILLTITLLHLRGNVVYIDGRIKLRLRLHGDDAWHNEQMRDDLDRSIIATVQRMIWFPISYFLLWAPVCVSRLMQYSHDSQSFGFVAFALVTYALTGFADVVVFVLTRHTIHKHGALTPAYADLEKERDASEKSLAMPSSVVNPNAKKSKRKDVPVHAFSNLVPRPLVLAFSNTQHTHANTTGMDPEGNTGTASTTSAIPHFEAGSAVTFADSPRVAPMPPPKISAKRLSDTSLITSARPPEPDSAISLPMSLTLQVPQPTYQTQRLGIGALSNGPKLSRNGSALSSASSPSMRSGPVSQSPSVVLVGPSLGLARSPSVGYTAQADILSAYAMGTAVPSAIPTAATGVSGVSDESFVAGAPTGRTESVYSADAIITFGSPGPDSSESFLVGTGTTNASRTDSPSSSFVIGAPTPVPSSTTSSTTSSSKKRENSTDTFGQPQTLPPKRPFQQGAKTFGQAVRAAGKDVVAPLDKEETYKAQMYGARFSLVAGPAPSYEYDRAN